MMLKNAHGKRTFALAIALVLGAGLVAAHAPVEAADAKQIKRAIQYRQGVFRVIGWDIGPLGAMAKGKIPFDAAVFAARAQRMADMAPRALEGFGPETNMLEGTPTRTNDKIWSNRADFEEKMQALVDATAAMAEVAAGGDKDAMLEALGKTGKSCKACHDEYREKEYR